MDIILSCDESGPISDIQNWLDYHEIGYRYQMFWDLEQSMYSLSYDINNSIVVCGLGMFQDFAAVELHWSNKIADLCRFLDAGNQIWLTGTDLAQWLSKSVNIEFMRQIDQSIRCNGLLLLVEAEPSDQCYIRSLENIRFRTYTTCPSVRESPRCKSSTVTKTNCRNSFLLTMRRKGNRPHREVLWKELNRRPDLLKCGLVVAHRGEKSDNMDRWVGQRPHQHNNYDHHASMDLYLDCWMEIVPETFYKDYYFLTEKINKPIITRTPFLVVTTAGYLTWLKNQGFKTFETLIDESYDRHHRVEDRVRHMANVAEDIIRNGVENFYRSSKDILDHNFLRLCEITGSYAWRTDQTLWKALQDFKSRTCSDQGRP